MWSIRYRAKTHLAYPRYGSTKGNNKNSLSPLSELARAYKYHPDYLSQLIRKGEIRGEKVGRIWCTTPAEIEKYKRTKQYVTLGYLLRPYMFEIVTLLIGIVAVLVSLWYWQGMQATPTPPPVEEELTSDLDIPVTYSVDS